MIQFERSAFDKYAPALFSTDSPSGYSKDVTALLCRFIGELGYECRVHNKGTVEDHPPQLLSYIREAAPTEYCKAHKLYTTWKQNPRINISHGHSPYWTATLRNYKDWEHCYKVQIVGYDGHLSWGGVIRPNVGIRPAAKVDLSMLEIASGSGTEDDPYVMQSAGN